MISFLCYGFLSGLLSSLVVYGACVVIQLVRSAPDEI